MNQYPFIVCGMSNIVKLGPLDIVTNIYIEYERDCWQNQPIPWSQDGNEVQFVLDSRYDGMNGKIITVERT